MRKILRGRAGVLAVVLLTLGLRPDWPPEAHAAVTGKYDVALLRVQFSDATGVYSVANLNTAATELHDFFNQLSYGQLNMQVRVVDVTLSGAWNDYIGCSGPGCRNLLIDAADAAAAGGFSFTGVEGILVVRATCRSNDGRTFGPATISTSRVSGTFQQSYVGECGTSAFPSTVAWGGWAHELGHQLESQDGRNAVYAGGLTHPTGYESGYNLMDSCYPCGEAALSVAPVSLANDTGSNARNLVFPGWLPADRVRVISSTSGTGETVVLSPITDQLTTTTAKMGIKIPIASGQYYFLEARRKHRADGWPDRTPQGIYDEGVQILKVDEAATDRLADTIDTCDTLFASAGGCIRGSDPICTGTITAATHPRCWPFPLWHTGNVFRDTANNIAIAVGPAAGNGFAVTVTRGVPPGTPDLFVTPWLTPPMSTWETIDIWVDSSCNGYEDAGGALRYGRRPAPDGTVIGNGDDPCANHVNRVYARIRNIGDAPATNASIRFEVSNPLGVGISGSWSTIGTATPAQFAALASIPANGETTVYVDWTPTVDLSEATIRDSRFAFHSCLRVIASAVTGERVTTNLDGDGEQENISGFEVAAGGGGTPGGGGAGGAGSGGAGVRATERSFRLTNSAVSTQGTELQQLRLPRTYYFLVDAKLPAGWTYQIAGGAESVELKPGESRQIPVKIIPGRGPAAGTAWHLKVAAYTMERMEPPPYVRGGFPEYLPRVAGGVDFAAQAVAPSRISIKVCSGDVLTVEGKLQPAVAGARVMLDYVAPDGKTISRLVATDADGGFRDAGVKGGGGWKVRSFWQGSDKLSSATTEAVSPASRGYPWWYYLIAAVVVILVVLLIARRRKP